MQSSHTLSVGFLLGSGVSLPAAPSTEALTKVVRDEVAQHFISTDDEWYPRPPTEVPLSPERQARQEQVAHLIPNLATRVQQYYDGRENPGGCSTRQCNYEDIAYIADSLANTLTRNRDDPGLMPLADDLRRTFGWSHESLRQAAEDTVSFIRTVVFLRLIGVHPPAHHLKLVLDAARDSDVGQLPIYTLNHDCLLEDAFETAGVPLFDFRRLDGSGRILLDLEAEIPDQRGAVLYKPHGSVRWRRFRPIHKADGADPWFTEWIGWHCAETGRRHDDGNKWRSIGAPLVLVGRFNKELDYLEEPYWPTLVRLAASLNTRKQIVVSGYGFGDKAINTLLINWIYAKPQGERRVIVMHNSKEQLLASARGSIADKWDEWESRRLLRWIPHFPCDYEWPQLKQVLHHSS